MLLLFLRNDEGASIPIEPPVVVETHGAGRASRTVPADIRRWRERKAREVVRYLEIAWRAEQGESERRVLAIAKAKKAAEELEFRALVATIAAIDEAIDQRMQIEAALFMARQIEEEEIMIVLLLAA